MDRAQRVTERVTTGLWMTRPVIRGGSSSPGLLRSKSSGQHLPEGHRSNTELSGIAHP